MNKYSNLTPLLSISRSLCKMLLAGGLLLSAASLLSAQNASHDGQSTEGTDFWVTFLQADQDPNNELRLSLSISSRTDCEVTISNPFTNYSEVIPVAAGGLKLVEIYKGNVLTDNARRDMATTGKICYAVNSEKVDTCALHVTSTAPIALFATNYKRATFDATNVIPSISLQDSYMIQTYTPSDHGGISATQGSHFAIIAIEDNTIVDYCPTEETTNIRDFRSEYATWGEDLFKAKPEYLPYKDFTLGDTLSTPALMKGQVYYVWTGKADGAVGDLSGTYVKARDGKKIAVFQGCPHTNIPYQKKQRDHIFSQAMPTQYWGNMFALTASKNRKRDIIRVMALHDGTEVRLNGVLQHTFDFTNGDANDKKHFFEFEIGEAYGSLAAPLVADKSCWVETSCPCAVHLFMVSQQYDGDKNNNGDPAMLWVNPIEQQIDQVTFATYASSNGTTNHYTNIVTDKPELMTLDGVSIAADFSPVTGSSIYYFAQKSLGTTAETHTLKSDGSNFIAHVYGFTENESYGYSAGGATKTLTSSITINGKEFTADSNNLICGIDEVNFGCSLNYNFEKIVWGFGDGTAPYTDNGPDSVSNVTHLYEKDGVYEAYALVYRTSTNLCEGQSAMDSIPIKVNIGRFTFSMGEPEIPCNNGVDAWIGRIPFNNESGTDLESDNTTIEFDANAIAAGFSNADLVLRDSHFEINIPDDATVGTEYGIHIVITSECGGTDTTLYFQLNYDADVLSQRADNVLGLLAEPFEGDELSGFQWYSIDAAGDTTAINGQVSATLNWYDLPADQYNGNTYFLCFYKNRGTEKEVRTCTCDKGFTGDDGDLVFEIPDSITIVQQNMAHIGERIFVNAKLPSTLTWLTVDGTAYATEDIPAGGRTVEVPDREGFYILRVATLAEKKKDVQTRNFKFLVTK